MANPMKGEAQVTLSDGRELTLVLDMEALVAAESIYGYPVAKVMADADAGFIGASRALLYGALRARHPEITKAEALGLLVADGPAIGAAIEAAAANAFPAPEGKEPASPPKKPRAGKRSGASGAKRA